MMKFNYIRLKYFLISLICIKIEGAYFQVLLNLLRKRLMYINVAAEKC